MVTKLGVFGRARGVSTLEAILEAVLEAILGMTMRLNECSNEPVQ